MTPAKPQPVVLDNLFDPSEAPNICFEKTRQQHTRPKSIGTRSSTDAQIRMEHESAQTPQVDRNTKQHTRSKSIGNSWAALGRPGAGFAGLGGRFWSEQAERGS